MKIKTLEEILKKKSSKTEFAILTNLENGDSEIYLPGTSPKGEFSKYADEIENFFKSKKNGVIENSEIFVETYIKPIKVIIVGAVHIAQYLVDFAKSLNFEISIIDPRGYFASEQRFPDIKVINKWPKEAFEEIETNSTTALIALTHDPKIDDQGIHAALNSNAFYIGCLGSKRTHSKRLGRLKDAGFSEKQLNRIHGPIGLDISAKSPAEISVSIMAQIIQIQNKLEAL